MGTLGAMRDASSLNDMAEQIEVDEIETHGQHPSRFTKAGYAKS
jgi:hypothetical protein